MIFFCLLLFNLTGITHLISGCSKLLHGLDSLNLHDTGLTSKGSLHILQNLVNMCDMLFSVLYEMYLLRHCWSGLLRSINFLVTIIIAFIC